MRLIENEVYEYVQEPGIDGVYKAIRVSAATCYQTDVTQSKLTPKEFTENVILKKGHGRALEFGTVYLKIPISEKSLEKYQENPYTKINYEKLSGILPSYKNNRVHSIGYVTTNMRVIMQGDYQSDMTLGKTATTKNGLTI
jgi:hypothetical protein